MIRINRNPSERYKYNSASKSPAKRIRKWENTKPHSRRIPEAPSFQVAADTEIFKQRSFRRYSLQTEFLKPSKKHSIISNLHQTEADRLMRYLRISHSFGFWFQIPKKSLSAVFGSEEDGLKEAVDFSSVSEIVDSNDDSSDVAEVWFDSIAIISLPDFRIHYHLLTVSRSKRSEFSTVLSTKSCWSSDHLDVGWPICECDTLSLLRCTASFSLT